MLLKTIVPLTTCWIIVVCCDLQKFFSDKRVSVEENAKSAQVIFRGLITAGSSFEPENNETPFVTHFQLINTYKGADLLLASANSNNYREVEVMLKPEDNTDCSDLDPISVPVEFLIFCVSVTDQLQHSKSKITIAEDYAKAPATSVSANRPRLQAIGLVRFSETMEQRVWKALGWSDWSEWSSCSVSCSGGIQQRTRQCLAQSCPEYNVEQRHCNLFGCAATVNPLALGDHRYFHPNRARWRHVPGRPNAWRLQLNSYIWVPAQQLFADVAAKNNYSQKFPTEFTLFVTLRLTNDSQMGTIFSLRSRRKQDAYLSMELASDGGVNLVHAAAANGTDVIRIPAKLNDGKWHQFAISVRDDCTVQSYVDCEWLRTDILKKDALDTPEDSDLIIGYLFTGDLEQMTIILDSKVVSLQCSPIRTPIIDSTLETTSIKTIINYSSKESADVPKKYEYKSKYYYKKKKYSSTKKELTDY